MPTKKQIAENQQHKDRLIDWISLKKKKYMCFKRLLHMYKLNIKTCALILFLFLIVLEEFINIKISIGMVHHLISGLCELK